MSTVLARIATLLMVFSAGVYASDSGEPEPTRSPVSGEQIKWGTFTGGVSRSSSSLFSLKATIGQTFTNNSSSGSFTLSEGVWVDFVSDDCCMGNRGNFVLDVAPDYCSPSDGEVVDIADLTNMIDHLFINYTAYCCLEEGDISPEPPMGNPDGQIDVGDLTRLIDFLFIGYQPLLPCP